MRSVQWDATQFQSRRKFRKAISRNAGEITIVRIHSETDFRFREQAFLWCKEHAIGYWGTDLERRRFYFSKKSEAVRFKLTWGNMSRIQE